MSKHGHVTPNPDGSKARCGGPVICAGCAREAANIELLRKVERVMVYTPQPGDVLVIEVGLDVEYFGGMEQLSEDLTEGFGRDVKVVVLRGDLHLAGVVRG